MWNIQSQVDDSLSFLAFLRVLTIKIFQCKALWDQNCSQKLRFMFAWVHMKHKMRKKNRLYLLGVAVSLFGQEFNIHDILLVFAQWNSASRFSPCWKLNTVYHSYDGIQWLEKCMKSLFESFTSIKPNSSFLPCFGCVKSLTSANLLTAFLYRIGTAKFRTLTQATIMTQAATLNCISRASTEKASL